MPDYPNDFYIGIEYNGELLNFRRFSKTTDGKRYVGWGTKNPRFSGGSEGEFNGKAYLIMYDIMDRSREYYREVPQNKTIICELTLEGAKKNKNYT